MIICEDKKNVRTIYIVIFIIKL